MSDVRIPDRRTLGELDDEKNNSDRQVPRDSKAIISASSIVPSLRTPQVRGTIPALLLSKKSKVSQPGPSNSKIVRLVRTIGANGIPTYTASVEQSSMSEQLSTNATNKSWKTPGGILVSDFTRNPLYKGPTNNLQGGRRKSTHKRVHRAQSHKRK